MKVVINMNGNDDGLMERLVDVLADKGIESIVINVSGEVSEASDGADTVSSGIDVIKALNELANENRVAEYRKELIDTIKYSTKAWVEQGWNWLTVDSDGSVCLYKHSPEINNTREDWDIVRVLDEWNKLDIYLNSEYWRDSLIHLKELV